MNALISLPVPASTGVTPRLTLAQVIAGSALNARCLHRIEVALAAYLRCPQALHSAIDSARTAGLNGNEIAANCQGRSQDARAELAVSFALNILRSAGLVDAQAVSVLRQNGYNETEIFDIISLCHKCRLNLQRERIG